MGDSNSDFKKFYSTYRLVGNDQLLFASQSYGTNYFIYGNFTLEDDDESTPQSKSCYITGLTMELINYKGILNLGFYGAIETKISKIETSGENPVIEVDIYVQAMAGEIPEPMTGESPKPNKYNITVGLDENIKIKEGTNLRVRRQLIPLAGPEKRKAIVNGVFDEEFYYRDGHTYAKKVVRDISERGNCFETYDLKEEQIIVGGAAGPGHRCRKGFFQIDFNF